MSKPTAVVTNLEQLLLDHVEMVFSVALELTSSTADAEKLTRATIYRALQTPERFAETKSVKRELLALLRENFLRARRTRDLYVLLKSMGTSLGSNRRAAARA